MLIRILASFEWRSLHCQINKSHCKTPLGAAIHVGIASGHGDTTHEQWGEEVTPGAGVCSPLLKRGATQFRRGLACCCRLARRDFRRRSCKSWTSCFCGKTRWNIGRLKRKTGLARPCRLTRGGIGWLRCPCGCACYCRLAGRERGWPRCGSGRSCHCRPCRWGRGRLRR